MKIVTGAPVATFVTEKTGQIFLPPFTEIGVERDGEIIGGVIFNNFVGRSIEASVAGSPKAWTPRFFRAVGDYVFRQNGCCRLGFTTGDETVIQLAIRLGAQTEGRLRDFYGPGMDATVLGVRASEWRF